MEIVRSTSTNWYKIKYKNSYAYVKGNYIKLASSVKVINRGSVSANTLNVRKSASTSSTKLGTLNKGDRVQIVQKQSRGWYKIRYKDSYAYIRSKYVKLSNSNTSDRKNLNDFLFVGDSFTARMENIIKSKNEMVYVYAQGGSRPSYWLDKVDEMPDKNNIDSVSLLIGVNGITCSTNSKFLGYLPKGTKVEIVRSTSTNWYKIKYKNSYAYVKGNYIKLASSVKVINRGSVSANTLNVRKSASTSSTKLGTLNKGDRVQIVQKQSRGWYKIRYKDSYAYIRSKYVKLSNSNTSDRKNLNDFLFVGDSFTARMENIIKSKNEMVYVYAQGGSRPSYWLDKVDEMPDKNNIDSVSLLIGVNGITLKEFCSTKSNVKIIDATKGFIDNKGYLTSTTDGLHIDNSKGIQFYNNIFSSIKNAEKK